MSAPLICRPYRQSRNYTLRSNNEILFLQNRVAYLQDEAAYKKLFFHFHPVLLKFARAILNNRADAEEVVSEVLLKVWTMGRELNYVEHLPLFLYKSTRNKAFDYLRKRNSGLPVTAISGAEEQLADPSHTEYKLITNELDRRFQHAVSNLPKQCQLVFRLVKEQGFTYKQVTEILEISLNTAETHMRLALKKIRVALDDYLMPQK
ncbi:sigma-70 family RNA polymerase sigma factor [Niabella sp. CC-SYL272]|uniref:RNA polymerase sigma factor n=1 Tax=Niabella agricola TaxID=2891571 RepID=UPI002105BC86|nr:sigma-70 family RNA polymerase sigma factor [Niabella agricola]MCF3112203.1 sigma-70 family RNA polymerase sigma factor [Niabella agricola]